MIKINTIAGDGIGPEVIKETLKVANAISEKFKIEIHVNEEPYSANYYLETGGKTIPEECFRDWPKEYDGILLGAFGDNRVPANYAENILLGLRRKLDLYINYRPVYILDNELCPLKLNNKTKEIEFAVFRENTEGLYVGSGGSFKKNTDDSIAIENSVTTLKGVKRIIEASFKFAQEKNKKSVVMVDKHNVMKFSGQIWYDTFVAVSKKYPDIESQHMFIDRACMELVKNPELFDVIVTSNMFGDILSDIGGQIQGGLGFASSANYNPENEFKGVFEPVHGSAPDIAGKNIANPFGAVLSFGLLMKCNGHSEIEKCIKECIKNLIKQNKKTVDLGGNLSTTEVGDCLVDLIMGM